MNRAQIALAFQADAIEATYQTITPPAAVEAVRGILRAQATHRTQWVNHPPKTRQESPSERTERLQWDALARSQS